MHRVRYFSTSAKRLNFTRAARECGVSAPSLLRAIKLLEFEFGGPLFNRKRRRTHLSELGVLRPLISNIPSGSCGSNFRRLRPRPSYCRFCCSAHKR
ncbi:LysR family transcriptional regulator [Hyphomicrobium sp.]|uniref:helix-turn-helix domain-containing protein n=1 Tax=Hyphomicrobium sp. TaxID=82 RepID=UPI0025BF0234|nr:LysR family transcriptional regulator [Hyphomicrobium sp.]